MPESRLKGLYVLELFKQEDLISFKDNLRKIFKRFSEKGETETALFGLDVLGPYNGRCASELTHAGLRNVGKNIEKVNSIVYQISPAFLGLEIQIHPSEKFLDDFHKNVNKDSEDVNKKHNEIYSALERMCLDVQNKFISHGIRGIFKDLNKNWPVWIDFEYSGEGPSFKIKTESCAFWRSLGMGERMYHLKEEKGRFELFYSGLYDVTPSNIMKLLVAKATHDSKTRLLENVRADYFTQFAVFLILQDIKQRIYSWGNDISSILYSLNYPALVNLVQREQALLKQKEYLRKINLTLCFLTKTKGFVTDELFFTGCIASQQVDWFSNFYAWMNETCLSVQEEFSQLQDMLGKTVSLKNISSNLTIQRLILIISAGAFLAAVLSYFCVSR